MLARFVSPRVLIGFPFFLTAIALAAIALSSPLLADISWREVDSGTPTLFDAMAYDEARQQLVLFAGDAYNLTWVWNGSGWTRKYPATSPGNRLGARMAYDPNTQMVIMFGGSNPALLNETWGWNGTTWRQLHPAHSPSARFAPGLVYDPIENKLVLFGGYGENAVPQSDTWTWDGTDWTQQITSVGPAPRFWPAMAYDPDTESVVLFGGVTPYENIVPNDTWTWTAAGWSLQSPTNSPPARGYTDMAYSPLSHKTVLFGGVSLAPVGQLTVRDGMTWEWDGVNWMAQQPDPSPGPRFYNSLALDKSSGTIVLQGGSNFGSSPFGETWTWNGSAWSKLPDSVPGKRFRAGMAIDSTRRKTVLFGGLSIVDSYLGDTWTWDGARWTQQTSITSPSPRLDVAVSDDPDHGTVVLFGGLGVDGYSSEIWTWDGTTWTLRHPALSPSARAGASMAYDAQDHRVILFGGSNGGVFYADTWTWDGENWIPLSPASAPGARQYAGLSRDPSSSHLVLFGGGLASGVSGETWIWDGGNWQQRNPSTSPAPRTYAPLACSTQLGAAVLYGGTDGGNVKLQDTWIWDGTTWSNVPTASGPGARNAHVLAEGPSGDVFLFGDADRNDTWSLGVVPVPLSSVVSRKVHGDAGVFDLALPLTGTPAIECRSGGPNGNYTLVFNFADVLSAVSSVTATATTSGGTVPVTVLDTSGIGTDTHQYILNLSEVPNASHLNVTLNSVTDSANNVGDVSAHMDVLLGDVNSSARTDSGDVTVVRNHTVSIPDQTTFRFDVNASGRIDSGDVTVTRNASVTVLP
jgi:hypothetical protein